MKKELTTRTGYGTCKVCNQRKVKHLVKTYIDGSMHFKDDNNKSWNASTCPECYSKARKLKRRKPKPQARSCKQCKTEFEPKSEKQIYCSKSCQKQYNNDKRSIVKDPQIKIESRVE